MACIVNKFDFFIYSFIFDRYYSTQQLTEKSDVYSFGVVLLELICGREPLSHSGTPDSFNLVLWVIEILPFSSASLWMICCTRRFVSLCYSVLLQLQAKPYFQAGSFEIVDDSLKGSFDVESMKKAALIAVRSVERDASQRPAIAEILEELKEAYSIQLSFLAAYGHTS